MSEAVKEILQRIQQLPEDERLLLEEQLAQMADSATTHDRNGQPRYPLRGSVIRFDEATEPVAEGDWEATR